MYEPCPGTGRRTNGARTITNPTNTPGFYFLVGKRTGKCCECGKSLLLGKNDNAPRHKHA